MVQNLRLFLKLVWHKLINAPKPQKTATPQTPEWSAAFGGSYVDKSKVGRAAGGGGDVEELRAACLDGWIVWKGLRGTFSWFIGSWLLNLTSFFIPHFIRGFLYPDVSA